MKPKLKSGAIAASALALLLFAGHEGRTTIAQHNTSRGRQAKAVARRAGPLTELRNAFQKLKSAYPYRLTDSRSSSENGKVSSSETGVTEYAAADRVRIKSSEKDESGSEKLIEMIIIGNVRYLLFEGKWVEETMSAAEKATMEADHEKFLASLGEVRFVGLETVDGVKCKAYSYRWGLDISVSGKFPEGMGKAWIRVANGLPHQMDTDLEIHGRRIKSHMVYEYDPNIKVTKPTR